MNNMVAKSANSGSSIYITNYFASNTRLSPNFLSIYNGDKILIIFYFFHKVMNILIFINILIGVLSQRYPGILESMLFCQVYSFSRLQYN